MAFTLLITGANRGIGLEFVKQYLADGFRVIACCRNLNAATELQELTKQYDNLQLEKLDVTSIATITALAANIQDPIDILINNAGIYGGKQQSFGESNIEDMQQTFFVNTIAPLKLVEAFTEHVAKSELKTVVAITSKMGSISDNSSGGAYAYRASKTALNMVMRSVAIDIAAQNIKTIVLHPGWVQTDMGGSNALIDATTSVKGMRQVIASKPQVGALSFYAYDGKMLEW